MKKAIIALVVFISTVFFVNICVGNLLSKSNLNTENIEDIEIDGEGDSLEKLLEEGFVLMKKQLLRQSYDELYLYRDKKNKDKLKMIFKKNKQIILVLHISNGRVSDEHFFGGGL